MKGRGPIFRRTLISKQRAVGKGVGPELQPDRLLQRCGIMAMTSAMTSG